MKNTPKLLLLFVLLAALSAPVFAQQAGTATFGAADSFSNDSIDLATLTPTVSVPVLSKKGAIPFSYNLNLTSYCFVTVINQSGRLDCTAPTGTPNSVGLVGMGAGYNSSVQGTQGCYTYSGFYVSEAGPNTVLSEPGWQGASGTRHPVGLGNSLNTCTLNQTFTATTTDNSGYTLKATVVSGGGISFQVWGPNGAYTEPHTNTGVGLTPIGVVFNSVTDTFGNKISTSGSVLTDTLNTPAITLSGNSYQWKDTTGTTQSLTANNQTGLTIDSGFPGASVYDSSGITLYPVVYSYPDGTSVSIGLEQGVGGVSTTTGRIGSVTLRTGATISYSYGAFIGPTLPSSLARTTPDGTTTYNLTYNSSTLVTTDTVLDPGKNKKIYTFTGVGANVFLTQLQTYQNTNSIASPVYVLLTTDLYCYNGNTSGCSTAISAYPITQRDVYHTIGTATSRTHEAYDSYGNRTSIARYDFGAGSPTVTTTITYGTYGTPCTNVGSSIYNEPCDVVTSDGTHTLSESRYTYSSKGFKTQDQQWVGGTNWLTSTYTPNTKGTVASSTSVTGLVTTYTYAATGSGGCNSLLLTGTSATPIPGDTLTTSATWDCNGAVVMSTTDPNGNGTSATYDAMFRPLTSVDESQYTTNFSYTSNSVQASASFGNGLYSTSTTSTVGPLGRLHSTQTTDGANYDTATHANGFTGPNWGVGVTVPCITSSGSDCPGGWATRYLDPLGRTINTVDDGGGTTSWTYLGSGTKYDTQVTLGPPPTGEHVKQVQTEFDGLGRIKSTCALQTSGGTSCGQALGGSGILTSNTYSFGAGTSTVVSTRGAQSRTVNNDALGRVTSTITPEAGTTTYIYDSDTTGDVCNNGSNPSPGNLMRVTYNNGSYLCYDRDLMGRITAVGNPNATTSFARRFQYDAVGYPSWGMTPPTGYVGNNLAGRLVEAETDNGSFPFVPVTDEWFSYDANGRITDVWESTPHSGGYYHTTVTYWLNGAFATLSGIPGYATYSVALNSNGLPYSSMLGTTALVNKVNRNGAGQPTTIGFGAGSDQDTYTYDANTGRMSTYTFAVGSATDAGTLTWNPNGTLGQLKIVDGMNAGGSQTCNFAYDDVARLTSDNCGSSLWNQTYSYDQYDNLTKIGNPGTSWTPGYVSSPSQNRFVGGVYDANGNVTYDLNNTYTWDAYNKMSSARTGTSQAVCGSTGNCVTYDALGRAVEKTLGGTYYELLYSPTGLVATMQGATNVYSAQLPMPAGAIMQFAGAGGSGQKNVNHVDWLGTVRLKNTLAGNVFNLDAAYTPYGEVYDTFGTTTGNEIFTGDQQNLFAGLFDTPNRELDQTSGSRWLSPDPVGAGWNAYAYPTNPNSNTDPTGLFQYQPNSGSSCCAGPDSLENYASTGLSEEYFNNGAGDSGLTADGSNLLAETVYNYDGSVASDYTSVTSAEDTAQIAADLGPVYPVITSPWFSAGLAVVTLGADAVNLAAVSDEVYATVAPAAETMYTIKTPATIPENPLFNSYPNKNAEWTFVPGGSPSRSEYGGYMGWTSQRTPGGDLEALIKGGAKLPMNASSRYYAGESVMWRTSDHTYFDASKFMTQEQIIEYGGMRTPDGLWVFQKPVTFSVRWNPDYFTSH